MATSEAKATYRRRKELIEPTFGIMKEQQSARRFLLRGVANVDAEWVFLAVAFNLRTLAKIWQSGLGRLLLLFVPVVDLLLALPARRRARLWSQTGAYDRGGGPWNTRPRTNQLVRQALQVAAT